MTDDKVYLAHILECIARVQRYTGGDRQRFLADTQVQDAVIHNLQTLAESTQRVAESL